MTAYREDGYPYGLALSVTNGILSEASPCRLRRHVVSRAGGRTEKGSPAHACPHGHLADVQATLKTRGIRPGEIAPDFELPRVGGGSLRLGELRDKPTLLHFGSFT
jgi:hypothetical protein